jgi:hypothetical protein
MEYILELVLYITYALVGVSLIVMLLYCVVSTNKDIKRSDEKQNHELKYMAEKAKRDEEYHEKRMKRLDDENNR